MSTTHWRQVMKAEEFTRFEDALRPLFLKLVELGASFAQYDRAMHSERNRVMHTAYRARARRRTRSHR